MRERFEIIRTTAELEALAPHWSALWQTDPNATPFQSPQWLLPWWRSFGQELRTVCVYHDDQLTGILPFYLYHESGNDHRKLLPLGVSTSDYIDGVFSPLCNAGSIAKALDLLCADDDWHALHLVQLRAGSKLLTALQRFGLHTGTRFETQSCSRMPASTLPELPTKIRRNAMYYRNRAQRAGNLEFSISEPSTLAGDFETMVRMHTDRWRERGEMGALADDRVVRWHREALPLLDSAGLLRLSSLSLDGKIIAILYSLVDPSSRPARTQYFYLPAYSIHHADLRPGTVLTALAIDHAAREGVDTIDMLRGEEEYKKLWHTEKTPTFGYTGSSPAATHRKDDVTEAAA